jgi:uncharacterized protein
MISPIGLSVATMAAPVEGENRVALDDGLLKILACPRCKGAVLPIDGGNAVHCKACQLRYPVRDGIPIMLVEEAFDMKRGAKSSASPSVRLKRVSFRVTDGPDTNMSFQLEEGACRALGRAEGDPNKTSVFNVDLALALDDSMKGLVLKYISQQFRVAHGAEVAHGDQLGSFRRAPDIVLTDGSMSRLHAMIFDDSAGVGILDLVSKNGTFVNGQEIESKMLAKGDVVEVGETKILFEG